MKLKDFSETLANDLADPEFVEVYLEESLADSPEAFLVALGHVIKANGGMKKVAQEAHVGRESLYKSLCETGNPEFRTVQSVLSVVGLRLSVTHTQSQAASAHA